MLSKYFGLKICEFKLIIMKMNMERLDKYQTLLNQQTKTILYTLINKSKHDEVNAWKINWLKNVSNDGGAMAEVIRYEKPDEIVLKSWTKKYGSMWGSTNINNMDKLIKSNKGLYEVLTTYPQKIYFDIDKKDYNDSINNYDYLKTLKGIIYEYFPDPDMAVSGSCTDDKTSYHIVLNNYILNNQEDKLKLFYI